MEAAPSLKYLEVPRPSSNYNETLLSLAMLREILYAQHHIGLFLTLQVGHTM